MDPKIEESSANKIRHADFEKIHNAFLTHYSKTPTLGEKRYSEWLKALNLDDSKPYCKPQESFQWAKALIERVKEDSDAYFFKVEALFPLESMNGNTYTREELLQATRTLTGKPSNLNHDQKQSLQEIQILAAQYEDDVAECFVRILKSSPIPSMIERKEIVNVSVEADWSHGVPGKGLVFEGLAWLTKDVLPGVPLTRIEPVEKIAEKFNNSKPFAKDRIKEQAEFSCVCCGAPADYMISVCQTCFDKLSGSNSASEKRQTDLTTVKEADLRRLVKEEVSSALKAREQTDAEIQAQKLLAQEKAKLSETEDKLAKTASNLTEAQKTIEQLQKRLPGGGLVKNPPKMIPLSEHIKLLESFLPAPMVEKSTLGMQRECQIIRAAIFQAQQKLKET